jgi:hypothetical protein
MEPSSPTLKLRGREHSNCTPWAQRTVDPKFSLPEIKLLDFLYGEWGVVRSIIAKLCQKYVDRKFYAKMLAPFKTGQK